VSYCYSASTNTVSQQAFTAGSAPATPYESQYFIRVNSTNTLNLLEQRIENVRTIANQSVTISFWAKSASAQTITVYLSQVFGSGGSAGVDTSSTKAITTSWARYSVTLTIPSVAGKTIGTGSYLANTFTGAINNALDIWGVQVEQGSSMTNFQTATGTIQGELAACQRYFYRWNTGELGAASFYQATALYPSLNFPVETRIAPTAITASSSSAIVVYVAGAARTSNSITFNTANTRSLSLALILSTGATAGQAGQMTLTGTIDASAEL
jgi:hypothetical protein